MERFVVAGGMSFVATYMSVHSPLSNLHYLHHQWSNMFVILRLMYVL